MRKISMLSFANIRKTKGHTFSLFLLSLITSFLLNAGLLVFFNFGSCFQKMTEELNTSNIYYIMPQNLYTKQVDQYFQTSKSVIKMQRENSLRVIGSIPYNGDKKENRFLFNDTDATRSLSKWKFVSAHLTPDSMSIYAPYILHVNGGYQLNDKLKVTVKDTVLTFTIKGFTDDAFFSSLDAGDVGFYLPRQTFNTVRQRLGTQYSTALIFANVSNSNSIEPDIKKILQQGHSVTAANVDEALTSIDLPLMRMARTTMASLVSSMLVAFAVVITVVCLIVIRFRISDSIEDDMVKIGSMKAIGYTSGQIVSSIALQFLLIAFTGSILGVWLSYFSIPIISDALAQQSGLMWVQEFDGVISGFVLLAILLVVTLVSFAAARRIHKIDPIVALRGGIVTHSFKRNCFPLHRSKGSLPILFALKSIFQNKKSSIMIAIILTFVSFASSFSFILFYNSTVDTTHFAEVPGIERPNAAVYFNNTANSAKISRDIESRKDVRKTLFYDRTQGTVDDTNCYIYVMDDFSKKETDTVYEGRYPRHDNEIAIAGIVANTLNKKVGDTITLKIGDKKADYLITGLSQGTTMGGTTAFLTQSGILKVNPNFKQQSLQIYLNKEVNSSQFLKDINRQYGAAFQYTDDMDKEFEQGMGIYTIIISEVGVAVLVVTIFVVLLVLYFVINSSIVRIKRQIGIQKAIGFTTFQLMNQISLGFLPPVMVGVILGSILGMTQTNALMSVVLRSMAVMKADFITTGWVVLVEAIIVILAYLTSMLITYRIRKISAYSLVSE